MRDDIEDQARSGESVRADLAHIAMALGIDPGH